jgi:hypothetical protein
LDDIRYIRVKVAEAVEEELKVMEQMEVTDDTLSVEQIMINLFDSADKEGRGWYVNRFILEVLKVNGGYE